MYLRSLTAAAAALLLLAGAIRAQESDSLPIIDFGGESAQIVDRDGGAFALWAYGSPGRRSMAAPPRWYMVQDSSMGMVFTEPSGIKPTTGSNFNGDIDLRALREVHALEVRALTFNVWDQYAGTYRMTRRRVMEPGDENGFDPDWYDVRDQSHEHLTSLVYVARVRLADGTILEADTELLERTAKAIDPEFEGAESGQNLDDLMRLWREFLRQLRGIGGLPGTEQATRTPIDGHRMGTSGSKTC